MVDRGKIARRPDGSLDTGHYRGIAKRLRSAAMRRWLDKPFFCLSRHRDAAKTGSQP